ncbi:adenosylcobinamide-GDP ribazoletransferase [Anaerovoracaceae bacterium 41-7]|jgi:adenosylcobinamide-GDP ribazoletransferase|uniref:adenosylcobinamide-GDP ribazoletransferase n=1 Tax=Emergencia sp. 1XD21-10 TaxID=2304569 RepID=UPI00137984A8|nr:adenosylcobinamide-GDP ribazoletransferase [Emergencia sp. 1XD21-10]MCI9475319.1 adenosylcobinamide-GDP ribazoletransferase [Emergencia sp.]NCF00393.1 adenosylcobinamide-GDP ribazoletransferase [Emergencia sp. 1XD21-10]
MKKFIIGFFMAWGNFITLPCPYKRWDSQLKNMMLAFLPSIGLVIGLLWMGLFWIMLRIELSPLLISFLMMFYIFAICGFMHMDGFMDCNDAIMSRRPLEERQRILKDSTVGAFAVVTVAFLLLAWFAAMSTAIYRISYADLLTLPVVSRAISGLAVLVYQPIGHSQYVEDYKAPGRWKYRLSVLLQTGLVMGLSVLLGAGWIKMLICSAVIAVVGFIACLYARKQLGGMSGDIAGYTICIGELAGIFALAVL